MSKKIFVDDVSIVPSIYLNSIFGGNDSYASANPPSPLYNGHIHNGRNDEWGFAPKIDLTDNITGRLTLPASELKSIKLSATQAVPLTSSLFWTLPIPSDADTTSPKPMYLNIFWTANGPLSPGSVAFRVDWEYLQAGQNVMPPSIISRGTSAWPANTSSSNNPLPTTFRFKVPSTAASRLYVNDTLTGGNLIQMTLPDNVPGATLSQFLLMGLEISSAPTITLNQPMKDVNIYAVEILYYSATIGVNTTPVILQNDSGLSDWT